MIKTTVETRIFAKLLDDTHGEYVEVIANSNTKLVDLRYYGPDDTVICTMCLSFDQAHALVPIFSIL